MFANIDHIILISALNANNFNRKLYQNTKVDNNPFMSATVALLHTITFTPKSEC